MQYAFCRTAVSPLRKERSDASEMVSQLLFGEIAELVSSEGNWAQIRTFCDNYEGWTDSRHLLPLSTKEVSRWLDGIGILPEMVLTLHCPWGKQLITRGAFIPNDCPQSFNIGNYTFAFSDDGREKPSLRDFALSYLNTPYLWGGKSPFGIDCSGFSQIVCRYAEKNIPRDAYQQCDLGLEIAFDEKEEGDLAFFHNDKHRITHVGVVLNEGRIIHASGWVRIDELKSDGIYKADSGEKTHDLFVIKRI